MVIEIGWFILVLIALVVTAAIGILNLIIASPAQEKEFELVVSPEAYDEIPLRLRSCKWGAAVKDDGISMRNIVLVRDK